MNYLLYGNDDFKINKKINEIIQENNISNYNITKYDLMNDDYKKILMDACTISLFQDKKIIIIYNSIIFNLKSNKSETEMKEWEKYLKNSNKNTIIIFVNETISSNKKVYKIIKEFGKIFEFNSEQDINVIIKDLFENYNISNELIELLINRVGKNLYRLSNEIEKIKLYKDKDLTITKDDIINLTVNNIEADYNKLIQYIIEDNKDQALLIYDEFLKQNQDVLSILLGLSKRIRLMYQAKQLSLKGYSDQDIANILKESKGYVYYLKKDASRYDSKVLLNYLNTFADMDYNFKAGKIDLNNSFKLFILTK